MRLTPIHALRTLSSVALVAASGCLLDPIADESASARVEEDLFDDGKTSSFEKLATWGTGALYTQALNLALGGYAEVETEQYGIRSASTATSLHDLEALSAGLAARFGETSLPAEVAKLRTDHLRAHRDEVYAESRFRMGLDFDPQRRRDVQGLGPANQTQVWVGFVGGDVETRVVKAYPSAIEAAVRNPLAAVLEQRSWILPRDMDDLRDMRPGESITMAQNGQVGLSFGLGIPIVFQGPYGMSVRAAVAHAVVRGRLDFQIVRLLDDQVLVDVGMSDAVVDSVRLVLDDGWGAPVASGVGITINGFGSVHNPHDILERVLFTELNKRVSLISAHYERTDQDDVRESLSRFRIDLTNRLPACPEVPYSGEQLRDDCSLVPMALEQLIHGELRLAQYLSNRDDVAGIESDLTIHRSGATNVRSLGFELFGMKFFRETIQAQGELTVETPTDVLSVTLDSKRSRRGGWFSEHGYDRIALAGFSARRGDTAQQEAEHPRSETNLLFNWMEGDTHMERDKLADHLDSLMLGLLGPNRLNAIAAPLTALGRLVQRTQLRDVRGTEAGATTARQGFQRQFEEAGLAGSPEATMARDVFEFDLASYRSFEPAAWLTGPPTHMELGVRLSDEAVRSLVNRTGREFRDAVADVTVVLRADRDREDGVARERARLGMIEHARGMPGVDEDDLDRLDDIEGAFEVHRNRFLRALAVSEATLQSGRPIGDDAILVQPADGSRPNGDLAISTTARDRRDVVARMIDALFEKVKKLDGRFGRDVGEPERLMGYALLRLTPAEVRDLRINLHMDLDNNWAQGFNQFRDAFRGAAQRDPSADPTRPHEGFFYPAYDLYLLQSWTRGAGVRLLGDQMSWDLDRATRIFE